MNTDRSRFLSGTNELSIYSDAEAEWLKVLLRWKQRTGRVLPSSAELLGLLERLGYSRAAGSLEPAELEFALSQYRERTCKRFPTWSEVLALLVALGYERPETSAPAVPRAEAL